MVRASRFEVPSSSIDTVKPASPGRPGGSAELPARTTISAATTGRPWFSQRKTVSPFGRWNLLALGSGAVETAPAFGTSFRQGSFDSTLAATALVGAGGVGGEGGSTLSPGTTFSTRRFFFESWSAAN